MEGWFNICKALNIIWSVNKTRGKDHMILSPDAEKAFHKIFSWKKLE
jgi:hypothetical protein